MYERDLYLINCAIWKNSLNFIRGGIGKTQNQLHFNTYHFSMVSICVSIYVCACERETSMRMRSVVIWRLCGRFGLPQHRGPPLKHWAGHRHPPCRTCKTYVVKQTESDQDRVPAALVVCMRWNCPWNVASSSVRGCCICSVAAWLFPGMPWKSGQSTERPLLLAITDTAAVSDGSRWKDPL